MLLAIGYPYPKVQLKYNNIARCQLVENREEFLKRFSHEANNWKMAEIGVFNGDFSGWLSKSVSFRYVFPPIPLAKRLEYFQFPFPNAMAHYP